MNDVRPRQFHDESNASEELVIDPWRSWTLLNSGTSYDVEGSFEMNTSRILQKDNESWDLDLDTSNILRSLTDNRRQYDGDVSVSTEFVTMLNWIMSRTALS